MNGCFLSPLLPVFSDTDALHLLKYAAEVVYITDSTGNADFLSAHFAEAKHVFRLSDADADQIVHDADTDLLFEDAGQIIFVDMKALGEVVERYFFRKMLVEVILDFHHTGLLCACLRFLGVPGVCHEEREQVGKRGVDFHVPGVGFH